MRKTLEFYLRGKYIPITSEGEVAPGQEPAYVAWFDRLRGCMAQSTTEEDALRKLEERRESYIRTMYAAGFDLPDPDQPAHATHAVHTEPAVHVFGYELMGFASVETAAPAYGIISEFRSGERLATKTAGTGTLSLA